jgi:hypothetical protein
MGPVETNQNTARFGRNSILRESGTCAEVTKSGKFLSHGLRVNELTGLRTTESSSGGRKTSSRKMARATAAKILQRLRTATRMPLTARAKPLMTPVILPLSLGGSPG